MESNFGLAGSRRTSDVKKVKTAKMLQTCNKNRTAGTRVTVGALQYEPTANLYSFFLQEKHTCIKDGFLRHASEF